MRPKVAMLGLTASKGVYRSAERLIEVSGAEAYRCDPIPPIEGTPAGGLVIIVAAVRRSERRVTSWLSTGACWMGCTCSARCWPSHGSGSCGSWAAFLRP